VRGHGIPFSDFSRTTIEPVYFLVKGCSLPLAAMIGAGFGLEQPDIADELYRIVSFL
jgi:hypothetical protein